jgi:ribosomal protein L29
MEQKESFQDLLAQGAELIKQEIIDCRKALLRFRMTGKDESVKSHIVRQVRRQIARLKTAEKQQSISRMKGE